MLTERPPTPQVPSTYQSADLRMRLAIDPSILTAFVIFWAAVVPTPGPNSLVVTHVVLTRGPINVALAIVGNMAGILLLAVAALLGMAVM